MFLSVKQRHKSKPAEHRKIALERIKVLFKEADTIYKEDPKLSNKYVKLARKISMKYKVKIPSELKKRFCKHCHCFLKPPHNCKVRLHQGKVVYHCLNCNKIMRFPYTKEQKAKRSR